MKDQEIRLSEYGQKSVPAAPVSRMMVSFARDFREGVDINLGVGYVNEKTIPGRKIEEALHAVLARPERYRQALNYGEPQGSNNLIHSIKDFYRRCHIGGLPEKVLEKTEVVIGPSGITSLLEAVAQVLPRGIVITTDPMYYIYCHVLERMGFEILAVPEDEEGIRMDRLAEKVSRLGVRKKEIQFLYIVTINNPTCTILSNRRRRQIVEWAFKLSAEEDRSIPVFFDKAYEEIIHDPRAEKPQSALSYDGQGIVYELGSLSKILAPALRIGYMMGPASSFLQAVRQRINDVGFSAPMITQEISSYLLDHCIEEQLAKVIAGYREKAVAVRRWIEEYLGEFLAECRGGQAGFYYYLTFADMETTEGSPFFRFASRTTGKTALDREGEALRPRAIYIPGEICVHSRGDLAAIGKRQLRISYGFEELEGIEKALKILRDAALYARKKRG